MIPVDKVTALDIRTLHDRACATETGSKCDCYAEAAVRELATLRANAALADDAAKRMPPTGWCVDWLARYDAIGKEGTP